MSDLTFSVEMPSKLAERLNVLMIGLTAVLIALVALDVHSTLRLVLTIFLVLFGPGSALVQWAMVRDWLVQLGLIIALSMASLILLSQVTVNFHQTGGLFNVLLLGLLTLCRPLPNSRWLRPHVTSRIEAEARAQQTLRRSIFGRTTLPTPTAPTSRSTTPKAVKQTSIPPIPPVSRGTGQERPS